MDKLQVIRRLTQLASERGGHISFRAFVEATGLSDRWLRDQPWFQGWNALLTEAGLETKSFKVDRTPPTTIAEAVAGLIIRSGKWPTEDELRRERARNSTFPSATLISTMRRSGALARLIVELGALQPAFSAAAEIAVKHEAPAPDEANLDEKIKGYVYMLRSGRSYKIGKSIDPSRRFREVRLELPDETSQVHAIATDDPSGIEAYWHQRFASKRVRNTEFFSLTAEDVRAFKRRKYQ
jgi:Meiotically up-regulated gene 113